LPLRLLLHLTLRAFCVTLSTLRLALLFSLLLLKLLHQLTRVSVATRCFSRQLVHLLFTSSIVSRRKLTTLTLVA